MAIDERVRIVLGPQDASTSEVFEFSQYQVSHSFMTIPSAFGVRVGSGTTTAALAKKYPPGTDYGLYVGNVLQHSGRLDGYSPDGGKGATELALRGRDILAQLHDDCVVAERAFTDITYADLTRACIEASGISGYSLNYSNEANRKAITGVKPGGYVSASSKAAAAASAAATIVALAAGTASGPGAQVVQTAAGAAAQQTVGSTPSSIGAPSLLATTSATAAAAAASQAGLPVGVVLAFVIAAATSSADKPKYLRAKVGESWYAFLKKEIDKVGLFLLAGVDEKNIILTTPQSKQTPTYEITRQRGTAANRDQVLTAKFRNDVTRRFSNYIVYGRGGGGKGGRTKLRAEFVDQEMVDLGFTKHWAVVDDNVKSQEQAEFLARKKAAEDRRSGWSLTYTVRGHRMPIVGSGQMGILAVDTIVRVNDDELDIHENLWVESVDFRGEAKDASTMTDITLMRPRDLMFGDFTK